MLLYILKPFKFDFLVLDVFKLIFLFDIFLFLAKWGWQWCKYVVFVMNVTDYVTLYLHKCSFMITLKILHRALCCLFRPDTDGTRVSKCGQLSQQTRRLDPMLFHCWSSAVGGGPVLKQHWVKSSRLLGSTQVSVDTHPSPTIIFSPADQGTFSKTAGQSQAYYNTWNWERGTYDVNHLHILTCKGAVSRVGSV